MRGDDDNIQYYDSDMQNEDGIFTASMAICREKMTEQCNAGDL